MKKEQAIEYAKQLLLKQYPTAEVLREANRNVAHLMQGEFDESGFDVKDSRLGFLVTRPLKNESNLEPRIAVLLPDYKVAILTGDNPMLIVGLDGQTSIFFNGDISTLAGGVAGGDYRAFPKEVNFSLHAGFNCPFYFFLSKKKRYP